MPKTAEKIKNCSGNVNNQVGLFIFRKQAVAMIQALLTEPRHQKHMKVISFFFSFGFSNWDKSYSAIATLTFPQREGCLLLKKMEKNTEKQKRKEAVCAAALGKRLGLSE